MKRYKFLGILIVSLFIISCSSEFEGFEKTKNGLYYKIIVKKSKEPIPIGDYAIIEMVYKLNDDSILFDTRKVSEQIKVQVSKPLYKGDINEAFSIIGVGDSARFIVPSDSFFIRNIGLEKLPSIIPKGSMIYFDIKITGHQTKEEFDKLIEEEKQKQKEIEEELARYEEEKLQEWLKENKIKAKPTESGLYYIELKKGKGKKVEKGKKVYVNYTGMLLDGKVFDTSYENIARENNILQPGRKYEPISFELGKGLVIKGWEEGLLFMNEGGKARLIIPSKLAYGAQGRGNTIEPFSTLIFDVEIVKVE